MIFQVAEFKELNKKWKENLEKMNSKKKELIEQKQRKVLKSMVKKKAAVEALIKINIQKKEEELEKMIERDEKSKSSVKNKIIQNRELLEQHRIELDEINKEKSNDFTNNYLVMHHSTSREMFFDKKMSDFKNRISKSQQMFYNCYEAVKANDGSKAEETKKKQFSKYEKQFIRVRKAKFEKKELEAKQKEVEQRREDKRDELEKLHR